MWTSTGIISFQAETSYKRSVLNEMQTSCINGTKTLCILNKTLFNYDAADMLLKMVQYVSLILRCTLCKTHHIFLA